jgi:glycosyltransferase 2 family protein
MPPEVEFEVEVEVEAGRILAQGLLPWHTWSSCGARRLLTDSIRMTDDDLGSGVPGARSQRASTAAGPPPVHRGPGSRLRQGLKFGAKLLVSAGILAYLLSIVPVAEIGAALVGVDLRYVFLGFAIIPFTGLAAALQQKVLTDRQGMRLSVARIAEINLTARFYDLFLPGSVGGLIRWRRMSLPERKPAEALAAIVFNRGLETVVMVALGLGFWFWARPPGVSPLITVALVVGFAALLLLQVGVFNRRFAAWSCRVLEGRVGRLVPGLVRTRIAKVLNAAGVYDTLSARSVAYIVALSLGRHLLGILGLVWLAYAVGVWLPFAVAGWIDSFLALVLMLPISIGGLGVREASLVLFLQAYGVAVADALALSALLLARKLLRAGAGGVFELYRAFGPRPSEQPVPRTSAGYTGSDA